MHQKVVAVDTHRPLVGHCPQLNPCVRPGELMTIRDKIAAAKFKLVALTYSGFAIFASGMLFGTKFRIANIIGICGFAIAFISIFLLLYHLRCLRCGGNLGLIVSQNLNPFKVSPAIKFCPYCGIEFDSQPT